jgi:hypothetical protein
VKRIALLAALAGCPQLPPESIVKIERCSIAYQRCVIDSATRAEYEACRAGVDAQCGVGGGRP